jgi:nucleoid-associated protein YgaU
MTEVVPGKNMGESIKKIPPMVWLGAVAAGLAVSYFMAKKKTAAPTEDTTTPTALVYTGTGGSDEALPDDTNTGAPKTNEDWARRAKQFLIGRGNDGAIASSAIDKYIAAQPLNQQEMALVSQAISAVGPTPQSLPPTTGTPGEPTTSYSPENPIPGRSPLPGPIGGSPQGVQGQQYTVKEGDTLVSISRTAYGAAPTDYGSIIEGSDEILNANWYKIKDPKNLVPGTVLYIPVINSNTFAHQGLFSLGGGAKKGSEQRVWQVAAGMVPATGAYYGSSFSKDKGVPSAP